MVVSILVVDDEADVAELFRQRFRREARQGTYVLHFANSGDQALQLLDDEIEPELLAILSENNMPGGRADLAGARQAALSPTDGDDGDGLW
jgi:CheY-like chemotaxis protein